jgi:bacillithiol biosynthesis deacetylase BshB1
MNNNPTLDTLAIAAHPDDIEITSGGLLIKLSQMGRKTGVLDLTRGEMGTFGDINDRNAEAVSAGEVMGLAYRNNLSLPDSGLSFNQDNKLKIAQVIRDTKPELVIIPHWEQRHPDHLACSRLAYDACFLSGLKKIELDGEPFRPRKIIYATYSRSSDFSFLVDISDEFEQKCDAVASYKSQFDNEVNARSIFQPGLDIYEYMKSRARFLGQMAGVEFAEGYVVKDRILIDDPQKMPISSI